MFFVKKKEIIPEIKIITRIRIIVFVLMFPIISLIATAAPVLVFSRIYNVMNEKPMTRVFVDPIRTKKPFLFDLKILLPIIAACPLPSPGRKLHNGDAIKELKIGLKSFVFGFVIFCLGIFVLFFIINIIFAVSSKENFEDSSNTAASQLINIIKTAMSKPVNTHSSEIDEIDNKEGTEIIKLSAEDEAFDNDDDTSIPAEEERCASNFAADDSE